MARTNLERAENGRELCALASTGTDRMPPEDLEAGLQDALANLLHFARRYGIDFDQELRLAREHHAVEANYGWGDIPA